MTFFNFPEQLTHLPDFIWLKPQTSLVKLFFALITDPTCPGPYLVQPRHAIKLKGDQGNRGGEHDTQIPHQAFSFSMASCRRNMLPSSSQNADVCPPHLRFLSLETYHIPGRETENTVSAPNPLGIWNGVSASLPNLTYLFLPNRHNSLTEIPFVGYASFLFQVAGSFFKIAPFFEQDYCERSKCCYGGPAERHIG